MAATVSAIVGSKHPTATRFVEAPKPSASRARTSYGATSATTSRQSRIDSSEERGESTITPRGSLPDLEYSDDEQEDVAADDEDDLEDDGPLPYYPFTWKYMSRLYLIVPTATILFIAALVLLVTFAWPPNEKERRQGQTYPHAVLWKPLLVGIFASCTIQTTRVPIWVIVSFFGINRYTAFLSTGLHSFLHEAARLASIPLFVPSPSSGFHSSYYLGLGWGVAESVWGTIQVYEQLSLYEDLMQPSETDEERDTVKPDSEFAPGQSGISFGTEEEDRLLQREHEDEAELERRVEILERMRERRDLEEVLGVALPEIPVALFVLWRFDSLLLNLGLTLIQTAFYYDPIPIYRHHIPHEGGGTIKGPNSESSPYLPLAFILTAVLHVSVSLVWKVVGRLGVGAVTWGALIVALGTVFAGLGAWGGVV